MPAHPKTSFFRPGPDALLLHMLQAAGAIATLPDAQQKGEKFEGLLRGIRRYQTSSIPPVSRRSKTLWQKGSVKLLQAGAFKKSQQTIVLVPSLINGPDILDLLPKRLSFTRFLLQQKINVLTVDWGDLLRDRSIKNLDDLLLRRLAPALAAAAQQAGRPVTVAGYCMGGLLAAGVFAAARLHIGALIFLATPWDFHADAPRLSTLVKQAAASMMAGDGPLSNVRIQSLFAMVDPDMALAKYGRFATLNDGHEEEIFVAVEDWLRTGRDLPGAIGRACLTHWYLNNQPVAGKWRIAGHTVRAKDLSSVPCLIVAPKRDKLVEYKTSIPLAQQIGKAATLLSPDCGHIGMMAGRRAEDAVWQPVAKWLLRRSTGRA